MRIYSDQINRNDIFGNAHLSPKSFCQNLPFQTITNVPVKTYKTRNEL